MVKNETNVYEEMGIEVYEMAQHIFEVCGSPNDFCHQTGLVFGGTNRIHLTSKGWRMDAGYCTPHFKQKFRKHFG